MTFRDKFNQLVFKSNEGYSTDLAIRAFVIHRNRNGITSDPNGSEKGDFFADGSPFDTFLSSEMDVDTVIAACVQDKCSQLARKHADELVAKGEELIREGYRLSDDNSLLTHSDFIGERPRTHEVSLVGIHNDHTEKKERK